ncbi:hypothetical protein DQP56_10725 [Mycolicibacter senuensis]|nr:hypothetical protein DQP56_10725 [Mycolicibacter senuensis]
MPGIGAQVEEFAEQFPGHPHPREQRKTEAGNVDPASSGVAILTSTRGRAIRTRTSSPKCSSDPSGLNRKSRAAEPIRSNDPAAVDIETVHTSRGAETPDASTSKAASPGRPRITISDRYRCGSGKLGTITP